MGSDPAHAVTGHPHGRRPTFRRELGRLDTVCLLVAAIVVLDTLGAVARGGMQTLTLLVLVAALFFVPAGLVIAELGSAFSQQGGPYMWARLAFGRLVGCLVAVIYWVETPVWVGGSLAITAVAATNRLSSGRGLPRPPPTPTCPKVSPATGPGSCSPSSSPSPR